MITIICLTIGAVLGYLLRGLYEKIERCESIILFKRIGFTKWHKLNEKKLEPKYSFFWKGKQRGTH